MRKIYILTYVLSLFPFYAVAEHPRIEELTRQKQQKMERLQKCEGTTKGLKIAGLSTLGLSTVGVVGNIVEAKSLKNYENMNDSMDAQITGIKKEIEDKKAEIAQQQAEKSKTTNSEKAETEEEKETGKSIVASKVEETSATSNYAADCSNGAKQNDVCTLNPNADVAKCMYVGKKDAQGNNVLTCTAYSCRTGYLLKLNPSKGNSLGICVAKTVAESECSKQGANCVPLLKNTPRNNVPNGAYQGCDCSGNSTSTTNTGTVNTSTATVTRSNSTLAGKDMDKDGIFAKARNEDNSCDIYKNGEWQYDVKGWCDGDMSKGEWIVQYDYGFVKGKSLCANNAGAYAETGTPSGTGGQYCWCKATRYESENLSPLAWVFRDGYGSASGCARNCASRCAYRAQRYSAFRAALFLGSGGAN